MSTLPKMVIDSVEIRTCEEFMPMGGKDFVYGRTHPKETQCSIKAKIGSTVRPGSLFLVHGPKGYLSFP